MATALAQVNFENTSGFSADRVVHTFHFAVVAPVVDLVTAGLIADQLEAFYNDIHAPGITAGVGGEMSTVIARSLSRIKVYDLGPPPPRIPVLDRGFTLTPTAAPTNMPNEVALVLSYRSDPRPGIALSRTRGRLFFGPLVYSAAVVAGDVRPASSTVNRLVGAGAFLKVPFGAAGQIQWTVYSPTQRAAGVPENLYTSSVAVVHVDDAFDTQRRRGRAAVSRVIG